MRRSRAGASPFRPSPFAGAGSNPLSCVAWSPDCAVFASVFAALSAVAAFNAVAPKTPAVSARPRIGQGEAAVTDGHKHLAQANRYIAQAEKHIAQQKKLIDKLERDGARDIDVAVSMLRALEVALRPTSGIVT